MTHRRIIIRHNHSDARLPCTQVKALAVAYAKLAEIVANHYVAFKRGAGLPLWTHPPKDASLGLPGSGRLKVGYVSSDLVNHPLAHLMQSVFGFHDRSRFEIFCYSLRASDNSVHRQVIERDVEVRLSTCSQMRFLRPSAGARAGGEGV